MNVIYGRLKSNQIVAQRSLSVSYLGTESLVVVFPRIWTGIGVEHEERVGQIKALSLMYF